MSAAIGVGIKEYAKMEIMLVKRVGRTNNGNRTSNAISVERLTVPKSVVVEWLSAAMTISLDDGEGTAFRWKYHCETVAAVVAL